MLRRRLLSLDYLSLIQTFLFFVVDEEHRVPPALRESGLIINIYNCNTYLILLSFERICCCQKHLLHKWAIALGSNTPMNHLLFRMS